MATVTFQQRADGYSGTADTYIRERNPDRTYAADSTVFVDGRDNSGVPIQGLISFSDIFGSGPGRIPHNAIITSATLTLAVSDGTKEPVSLHRMMFDWTASPSWTWDAYGNGIQTNWDPQAGTGEALATPDLTVAQMGKGNQFLDVTSSVQAWAEGAPNYGWLLSSTGSDGWAFSSSESGKAPVLSVTYEMPATPVPGLDVVESDGSTVVAEGGSGDTFEVALNTAPTSNVTVTVTASIGGEMVISPTQLTFTPINWQTARTISLSAIDDSLAEGTESLTVTLTTSSSDASYNGLSSSIPVAIIDNDAAPPPLNPALVAMHDTTLYKAGDPSGYGCGDPSGLAYVPELDLLFIADSEHDESPYFSTQNLFATRLDGTFVRSYSLLGFTHEPTGLAYNPQNGMLYITDDDADRIFIVNPMNPETKVGEINVRQLGITDAEDPVIDPVTGNIYLLDGVQRAIYELSESGQLIGSTVLPSVITDAEGLAFDPLADVFYIASGSTRGTIFQTDRSGSILATIDLLNDYRNPITGIKPKLKGLELAPSSDPNDGDRMHLYAADYGVDQQADGRVFEVDLHHDWLGA